MATMLWILLLQFINSVVSGVDYETLCTSNACFTLHTEKLHFWDAQKQCEENGGHLMTVRNREEEDVLYSLISLIQSQRQEQVLQVWIGLTLKRSDCVFVSKALRGFKWTSGEEESEYSNWKKEPSYTCTAERCVMVEHNFSGEDQMKWVATHCKNKKAFYGCKFYFKGMCEPLALLGSGNIRYTAPFSQNPQRREMKSFPVGTYANILCSDKQSHYSVCVGSRSWSDPGPFCKHEKRNCKISNGGCEHLCHQSADEDDDVRCFCYEGYELEDGGLSCRIKHLCGPNTCEHECVMRESGYFCKCPAGFKLHENQRNCSDIDECLLQACEDHLCLNTPGSYMCTCKDGYQMIDGQCSGIASTPDVTFASATSSDDPDEEETRKNLTESSNRNTEEFHPDVSQTDAPLPDLESDGITSTPRVTLTSSTLSHDPAVEETRENFIKSLTRNAVELHPPFSQTDAPLPDPENDGMTSAPHVTFASSTSSDDPAEEETRENFMESLTRTTVELQHQSPQTDAPLPDVNVSNKDAMSNKTLAANVAMIFNSKVIICVLGSVIPLLVLVSATLFIAIFRCSRSKKQEKKKNITTDGYCWVSSGLDPRLEKLYESILTDDV